MAQLHISLLGTPQIQLNNAPIEFERRKALALFAYLVITRQVHNREALASLFFPDGEQSRALAYLRNTLWTINKQLGDGWLEIERDTVRAVIHNGLWVDVLAFEGYEAQTDVQAWQSAVALYRDDFMRGFSLPDSDAFDEWQFFQSQSLRQRLGAVLEKLVRGYIAQNRYEEAIPYARRWVLMDNLNESAHRNLMRLYDWTGQRTAALRQFQDCANLLREELGIAPDEKTKSLYQALHSRQLTKQTVEVMALALTTTADPFPKPTQDNLPTPSTPFISRERDLTEVTRLLNDPSCRLLTLIGQGGTGKTRLSLQTGESLRGEFEDGVYFVSLAPVTSAESLIGAIADSLRFSCVKSDLRAEIFDYLRSKKTLLILDNFEHLLDHAELISELLTTSPCTKIVTTSRERLNLREEWIYEVGGLTYPHSDLSVKEMESYEAIQLFYQSAKQIQPDFALSEENIRHIAHICQLVEGLPLGIELAAGWLQMLSPKEIAHEIQRSYDFLSASLRNLPPRHRSMKAMFESSWERLSASEAYTLCRLAVFRGGFDRPSASHVANAELPILLALVNKSLIRRTYDGRYDIHELLRQFAEEKLSADADAYQTTRTRHSHYYAERLEALDIDLKGARQIETLNTIERDMGNFRAAWSWACLQHALDLVSRLHTIIMLYFMMRSRGQEVRELCDEALYHLMGDAPETLLLRHKIEVVRAIVLRGKKQPFDIISHVSELSHYFETLPNSPDLGLTFIFLNSLMMYPLHDLDMGEYWIKRAQAIFEGIGDTTGIIVCLRGWGWIVHERINYVESKRIFQQALVLSQQNNDTWNESECVKALAEVAYTLGDYTLAEELSYEGVILSEKVGDRNGVASGLSALANVQFRLGKYDESEIMSQQCIRLWHDLGNLGMVAWQTETLAELRRAQGHYDEAEKFFSEIEVLHIKTESQLGAAWVWVAWAWLKFLRDDFDGAEALLEKADNDFDTHNHTWGRVVVNNHRAEIACSKGNLAYARVLIDRAIDEAEACQSIMFQTRNWVTLGRILAEGGDKQAGLEWLKKAIAHHATWGDVRERALQLQTNYLVALARA
jgi:predicted ATPase/DNA-binding SARP family transcriptional activator